MRQAVRYVALFVALGLLSGCASDPVGEAIQNVLSQMDQATVKLKALSDTLEGVLRNADKDNNGKIVKKDLTQEPVKAAFKELHDAGMQLVARRDKAEQLKGKVTEERQKELQKEYANNLRAKLDEQKKEWDRLKGITDKIREQADDTETRDLFEEELRNALADFESLTRQK